MATRKTKRSSGNGDSGHMSSSDGELMASVDRRLTNLSKLTNSNLRRELEAIGEDPGPINSSNRELYEGLLGRRWRSQSASESCVLDKSQSDEVCASPRKKPRKKQKPKAAVGVQMAGCGFLDVVRDSPFIHPVKSSVKEVTMKGIVPAAYTPFTEDGEVNFPVINLLVDHYLKSGIKAIYVNGTTGEGLKLTMSERKLTAERWIQASAGRLTVMVHVGTPCMKDVKELASHAESAGADAIATIPPIFHKPVTISNLVTFLKEVSMSAPTLPLFLYHLPAFTHVDFNVEDVLREARSIVPNLCGVKYSDYNLYSFSQCLQLDAGRYQCLYGVDQQLLPALTLGAKAAIGSTYNYNGKLNNKLIAAFERGDLTTAQKEQSRSQATVRIMKKYGKLVGEIAVGKAIMQLIGMNIGPVRLPDTGLLPDQLKELRKDLNEIGFFDWQ